jgi:hypothetical protein
VFILHGTGDAVIHVEHSLRLFSAAREPKQLWVAPGAAHCALHNLYPAEYERRVLGFIAMCVGRMGQGLDARVAGGAASGAEVELVSDLTRECSTLPPSDPNWDQAGPGATNTEQTAQVAYGHTGGMSGGGHSALTGGIIV